MVDFLSLYLVCRSTNGAGDMSHYYPYGTWRGRNALFSEEHRNILSEREKEILRCIRKGLSSKEIAAALYISVNTVNRHRQNILEKLSVSNSIEACRAAELMKLLDL